MDDLEYFELPKPTLAQEAGKAFLISLASSAGLFGGMAVVGAVLVWKEKREERKTKKALENS